MLAWFAKRVLLHTKADDTLLGVFLVVSARCESIGFFECEDSCLSHYFLSDQPDLQSGHTELKIDISDVAMIRICIACAKGLHHQWVVLSPIVCFVLSNELTHIHLCVELLVRALHIV